jgi:hypothetical protein
VQLKSLPTTKFSQTKVQSTVQNSNATKNVAAFAANLAESKFRFFMSQTGSQAIRTTNPNQETNIIQNRISENIPARFSIHTTSRKNKTESPRANPNQTK